jgi:transposase
MLGPAAAEALPVLAREVIAELLAHLRVLDERIAHYDRQQRMLVRQSEPSQRLDEILGVGSATALSTVASVGNGTEFENGRQFSAWMGLVPRQWTTGGKGAPGPHYQDWRRIPAHALCAGSQIRAALYPSARRYFGATLRG